MYNFDIYVVEMRAICVSYFEETATATEKARTWKYEAENTEYSIERG
jgi:hypothetical protein